MNASETTPAIEAVTQLVEEVSAMDAPTLWSTFWAFLQRVAPKLLTALILLLVGVFLVRWAVKVTRKLLGKSRVDPTLHSFLLSIFSAVLYIVLGITVLMVLVPSAVPSLVALFGVFGLAISLAVKDSLANLAGGMSVLFTKPFALEDYVKIGGNEGTIEEIRLNYTVLRTLDNKVVHIPNGDVAKAEIVNFTSKPTRRLDLDFSIGYGDDFERAEAIIRDCLARNPLALSEPAPVVRVVRHADSAIVVGCRVWVNTPDYWALNFDLLEEVKRRFDAEGVNIPYNQVDVHLVK